MVVLEGGAPLLFRGGNDKEASDESEGDEAGMEREDKRGVQVSFQGLGNGRARRARTSSAERENLY